MEPAFYREYFAAEDWDWWHAGRRRVLASVLDRALAARPPGACLDMLDVGCGTGATTAFLGRGHRVVGCDLEPEALRLAATRGLERLVLARAERLPFREGSFDIVMALDVLEHHDDDSAVAAELARVVRPGGIVLVTVPALDILWGPHDVISRHVRRYDRKQLVRVLAGSGLRIQRTSFFNTLLFPGVLAVQVTRKLLRRGRPAVAASDLPQRMPAAANALLRELFASERFLVPNLSLPVGVSLLALATREPS